MPSKDFLGVAARRAALDRHNPLRGHGKDQKNSKQQSTSGWQRARAAGGMGGGMEVTPYARIRNLVGRRRRAAINCRLPLFWVLKAQKKSNNNQLVGVDVWGPLRDYRGPQK